MLENKINPPTYWFGYRYKPSGDYQVKLYRDSKDIKELHNCVGDTIYWFAPAPFTALSREEALKILYAIDYHEKLSYNCGIEPDSWAKIRSEQETFNMLKEILDGKKN